MWLETCARGLCAADPPCGCAVLCSGNYDGFCASQSPSQQDTHIKGSFSGWPRMCVSVCFFTSVCVFSVCIFVTLRTSFSVVHADCASRCAHVQPIKVHIGTLAHNLPALRPPPFLSFHPHISPPCMILCCPHTAPLYSSCVYQLLNFIRGASYFFLLFDIANQSNRTSENNSSFWRNFGLHSIWASSVNNPGGSGFRGRAGRITRRLVVQALLQPACQSMNTVAPDAFTEVWMSDRKHFDVEKSVWVNRWMRQEVLWLFK